MPTGTYALFLHADRTHRIDVGALGAMTVQAGTTYVYTGSAFGPGGLEARVGRHMRGDGALHWHIDYLRAATVPTAVWVTADDVRRECDWAAVFRDRFEGQVPMDGFGASDCGCSAHLVGFDAPPVLEAFRTAVHTAHPEHAPIRPAIAE